MGRDRNRDAQRQGRPLTNSASDELDGLFATPPAKFIDERKRIVAALKGAGRKDEAKAVEKIPRPSLAVWTVNQIARRDPELVRRLGAITERLRVARGAEYAAAAAEHRQVLGALRDRAGEVLAEAGHDADAHIIQRVSANLRAAAGGADTRATLERGRLERDLEEQEAAGLFGMAAAAIAAPAPKSEKTKIEKTKAEKTATKAAGAKAKADAEADAAAARAEERARAKQIAAAEREVKRLRDEAAAARKHAERAERAVAAAQQAVAAAEEKLASDRATADAADDALARAEAELADLSKR